MFHLWQKPESKFVNERDTRVSQLEKNLANVQIFIRWMDGWGMQKCDATKNDFVKVLCSMVDVVSGNFKSADVHILNKCSGE